MYCRLTMSSEHCSDYDHLTSPPGFIRLFDIESVDLDGDSMTDGFVAVGGVFLPDPEMSLQREHNEYMLVVFLDSEYEVVWSRILDIENNDPDNSYALLRSVVVESDGYIQAVGESNNYLASTDDRSYPTIVRLTTTGEIVDATVLLKENNTCDRGPLPSGLLDTHVEQIASSTAGSFIAGTSFAYESPLTNAAGTSGSCQNVRREGNSFALSYECLPDQFSAVNVGVVPVSTYLREFQTGPFTSHPSVVSKHSTSGSDVDLDHHPIPDPCRFVQYHTLEIEPITLNDTCPDNALPFNSYTAGTHNGIRVIDSNCHP